MSFCTEQDVVDLVIELTKEILYRRLGEDDHLRFLKYG